MRPSTNHAPASGGERKARRRRAGARATALAGTVLLVAACGGSATATRSAAHQTAYQRELAYAECMRAHGLPTFPDPRSDGTFNSTRANAGDFHGAQFLTANKACAHLEGPGTTPAQQRQFTARALRFVACMHAHAIANFQYSPATDGDEGGFGVPGGSDEVNSPQFLSAQRACRKLSPLGGS